MRTVAAVAAVALLAAACGDSEPRTNVPRPPAPVTLTAAVHDDLIQVSPATVGAGPIILIVSNQTRRPLRVTFETDELGGMVSGVTASTPVIAPQGTGRLSINPRKGRYSVHAQDRRIRAAHVKVGPRRPSSQNQLLLP